MMMASDKQNIRDKLNDISNSMKNLSLETVKIALLQSDLCEIKKEKTVLKAELIEVKKENAVLKAEMIEVKKENTVLKAELIDVKNENTELKAELSKVKVDLCEFKKENIIQTNNLKKEITVSKGLNNAVLAKLSELGRENTDLKKIVDTLRNDIEIIKSTFPLKGVSIIANSTCTMNETGGAQMEPKEANSIGNKAPTDVKKPKKQRQREQAAIFRNWRQTMKQRKIAEELWASGLLKNTIELWEDGAASMNGDQILDFVKRNDEQLTTFITSVESKTKFFLTLHKMCTMRNIAKPKFEEIVLCFVNHGPKHNTITESEIKEFFENFKYN
ncbi:UPF0612 protein [Pseudolycoriella hygida]|uniref:UPF0612 protein n=1 Tax=Pseudolycoriella hygida TaxID=35572 RepID=A0A9Q0N1Q5_9DIPT|nr:UPF0612 protein [Pseudolycoriella hygida]